MPWFSLSVLKLSFYIYCKIIYKVLSESSWTRSKHKCWLNLLNFSCHLLGNIHSDPIISSTLQKHRGSHLWYQVPPVSPFRRQDTGSKRRPFSFIFNLGNKAKSQGLSPVGKEDGNNNHVVVSHKLWSFIKSQGINFAAMRRMFNYLLISSGKLRNWSQQSLWAHGLFSKGLHGLDFEFFHHFLAYFWCLAPWTFVTFSWHSTGLET
jgi:hypothetical protein